MTWNSPGQNTGVGILSLIQGIFPTQGSNPSLLRCRRILYQLSHKGSPRILEWVAYPFSSGSSQPRNWTRVSCIAGGFFTNRAIRDVLINDSLDRHKIKGKKSLNLQPYETISSFSTCTLIALKNCKALQIYVHQWDMLVEFSLYPQCS